MTRQFAIAIMGAALLFFPLKLQAQNTEAKLNALEKLPAAERLQKLIEGAKGEDEAVIYANMDVSAMKPLTDGFIKRYPRVKFKSHSSEFILRFAI